MAYYIFLRALRNNVFINFKFRFKNKETQCPQVKENYLQRPLTNPSFKLCGKQHLLVFLMLLSLPKLLK